ncbi:MAG: ABC transporter permease [Candidatus Omnitrophica bacterium]|nr:ABC transporter permease [Candidatus Omnitrophota bacterium]
MVYLSKVTAFIRKEFLIQSSYWMAFIFSWLGILISAATFYFISKLLNSENMISVKAYGAGYFPYVLIGIAFSGYFSTAMHTFSGNIRSEQITGTLEAMLVTPTRLSTIIISLSLWDFIFTSINAVIYLFFGAVFFKVDFTQMNIIASLLILTLTVISLSGIGIISASFIIVFKKGDPVSWLVTISSGFFSGVFFPVEVLPKYLRVFSYFLPLTYSLKGLRHAILQGYSIGMLLPEIAVLFAFCIILTPLSIKIFGYALRCAKISGSLTHY